MNGLENLINPYTVIAALGLVGTAILTYGRFISPRRWKPDEYSDGTIPHDPGKHWETRTARYGVTQSRLAPDKR